MKKQNVPENFLWGAATASFQAEGFGADSGKGISIADINLKREGLADTSVTSDHYGRFREDVQWMKQIGLKSYHFSIAWSRILPEGNGKANEAGIRFYEELINELVKNQIEPIVTMVHFDIPYSLVEQYDGWHSRRIIDDFENYCRILYEHYGDRVKYWIPMSGFNSEVFYPKFNGGCDNPDNIEEWRYRVAHIKFLCHSRAVALGHELCPGSQIGCALEYSVSYAKTCRPEDKLAVFNRNTYFAFFFYDVLVHGKYPNMMWNKLVKKGIAPVIEDGDTELLKAGKPDFIGAFYYESTTVAYSPETSEVQEMEYNLTGKKGNRVLANYPGMFKVVENEYLEVTDWDWPIDPMGFRLSLLELYDRYQLPLIVAENGYGSAETAIENGMIEDDERIQYLASHIEAMKDAMEDGVEIISYNLWSMFDILSTSNGYTKRYGLLYVNRDDVNEKDMKRIPKKSYYWYQKVIASNGRTTQDGSE